MNTREKKVKVRELIARLISGQETEEKDIRIHAEISKLVIDPEWSDYIFHSDDFWNDDDTFDIEGVVEKIFSYNLSSCSSAVRKLQVEFGGQLPNHCKSSPHSHDSLDPRSCRG